MHRYNTDSRFVEKFLRHQWMLLTVKGFPGTEIQWTFLEVHQIYQKKAVLSTEYVLVLYINFNMLPIIFKGNSIEETASLTQFPEKHIFWRCNC